MDEITSRLLDKTEFNVSQEYWLDAAFLPTFLAVEKSKVDAVEIAARRAKKGAACKANYVIPLHSVGGPKYR
ncbi:hypothetical protein KO525_18005 [Psychrosphaera sp. B3R10]|uniref:hypothetical protein n=1 Tax=Psychrosphaera sp. B3R10 TaxID=2841569 RepID=UPI001C087D6A|nr:hypothetical protein [Psychrosphaera sp. B3R10]MBU2991278.1 hypothetical protein [Psychrosphaera sp. B3R10]